MWLIKAGARANAPDNLDHTTLHLTVTSDAKEVFSGMHYMLGEDKTLPSSPWTTYVVWLSFGKE